MAYRQKQQEEPLAGKWQQVVKALEDALKQEGGGKALDKLRVAAAKMEEGIRKGGKDAANRAEYNFLLGIIDSLQNTDNKRKEKGILEQAVLEAKAEGKKEEERFQPVSHLSYIVPVPVEQPKFFKPRISLTSAYNAEEGFSGGASVPLEFSKKEASLVFAPSYQLGSGRKPLGAGNLSLSSSLAVRDGRLGVEYGLLSGWSLSLAGRHGIGLYYGRYCDGLLFSKPSAKLYTQYGPVGDIFDTTRLIADARKGNLGFGIIFNLRALAELGYSAVKSGIDAIWPKITTKAPDEKTIAAVREGKADIFECLRVLAHPPSGDALRRRAGERLEELLISDLDNSLHGKESVLSLSDYDRLMPILQKNHQFLSSVGWAQIRQDVDLLRMSSGGAETFKFVKNLSSGGWAGKLAAGALNSFLSIEEMGFGKPLDLRWHGWNLPYTIADTAAGWFEGALSFRNTSEGKGLFGKIFGFLEDVAGDVFRIGSRIIGTVSPVYRKSDARADEARENISSAIRENEALLSGKELSPDEKKAVYSNMLYLSRMLQVLSQENERRLTEKISQHLSSHKLFYELLSCEMTRAEALQAISDLESGKYSPEEPRRQEVRERLQDALSRLLESYLFLSVCRNDGAFSGLRKNEMESIRELFKSVGKKHEKEVSAGTPLTLIDFPPPDQAASWNDELSEAEGLLGSLSDKSMDRYWQVVVSILKKEPTESLSGEEDEAVGKIFSLARFAGKYPVLQGYVAQWAKGKGKVEELMPLVATKLSERVDVMDYAGVNWQLDWLTVLERLFPSDVLRQEANPALKKSLASAFEKLEVSADEMKDDEQRLKFISDLDFGIRLASGLGGIAAARQAYENEMKKGEAALRKSAKALYELSRSSDTEISAEAKAKLRILYNMYGEKIFALLSEKQADAVREMLIAGTG